MRKFSLDNFMKNSTIETELTALKTEHSSIVAKAKELEAKIADSDKTISSLTAEKAEWQKATEQLKTDHATALDTIKKEYQTKVDAANITVEQTKGNVHTEVVAALTSVGIQQGVIKESVNENVLSIDEARVKLASLKGTEAQAFYTENKKLFLDYIKFPKVPASVSQ